MCPKVSLQKVLAKSKRHRHGVGAKISVYKKFLHRALVTQMYPNAAKTDILQGPLAIRQEEKTVSKKEQSCIVMRHKDFDDGTLLHAVARYCKLQQEGSPEHYFIDASQDTIEVGTSVIAEEGNEIGVPIPTILNDEDVSNFRALGFCVDDDNEPAPEDIPTPNANPNECTYMEWKSVPIDERRVMAAVDVRPILKGADPSLHTILGYFFHFLPVEYLKTVVIPQKNAAIKEPVTWGEFLRFLGIIFILATTQGNARKDF